MHDVVLKLSFLSWHSVLSCLKPQAHLKGFVSDGLRRSFYSGFSSSGVECPFFMWNIKPTFQLSSPQISLSAGLRISLPRGDEIRLEIRCRFGLKGAAKSLITPSTSIQLSHTAQRFPKTSPPPAKIIHHERQNTHTFKKQAPGFGFLKHRADKGTQSPVTETGMGISLEMCSASLLSLLMLGKGHRDTWLLR